MWPVSRVRQGRRRMRRTRRREHGGCEREQGVGDGRRLHVCDTTRSGTVVKKLMGRETEERNAEYWRRREYGSWGEEGRAVLSSTPDSRWVGRRKYHMTYAARTQSAATQMTAKIF